MSDQLMHFDVRKPLTRMMMILALVLTLIGSWFVVRWYMGNTFAEFLNPEENGLEMGRRAVSLAPNDPLTHWRLAEVVHTKLPPDQLGQVVNEYEKAVSLSPNDYRFWMSLGTALEQVGESERAEKALRRAVELAPSYAYPHWYLGNLLLRAGSYSEAFGELRRATDADPELRSQLFNLAWEVYKQDFGSLKMAIGTTAAARAEFAQYLLGRQRIEDAILLWKTLSDTEKRENLQAGQSLIGTLVGAKRYHQAADISNDLVPTPAYRVVVGQILNGGFEENIAPQPKAVFGWQVKSAPQMQIGIDPSKGHSGRSLRIVFQVLSRVDLLNPSQLILVEPETQYDFAGYVRTEKLQSGATPFVEIVNSTDGSLVAASPPAANGNSDWQPLTMSFKTGAKTEAVTIRINRGSCGQDPVCPLFGTVWYDDFNLKRRS